MNDCLEYRKSRDWHKHNEENLLINLLIHFDEMGFCPTTLCKDPEQEAIEWKKNLINAVEDDKKELLQNVIKKIDMEIAYQESIISNNEKLLEKLKGKEELSFDRDLYRISIFGTHNVKAGLLIARNIISNYMRS